MWYVLLLPRDASLRGIPQAESCFVTFFVGEMHFWHFFSRKVTWINACFLREQLFFRKVDLWARMLKIIHSLRIRLREETCDLMLCVLPPLPNVFCKEFFVHEVENSFDKPDAFKVLINYESTIYRSQSWRFGLSVKKLLSQSTAVSCRIITKPSCPLCSDVSWKSCKGPTSSIDSCR